MPDIPGYSVAKNGFHFSNNDFPDVPMQVMIWGHPISFFTAGNGLCGGITFLGRDYFEAGLPAPDVAQAPSSGPLFQALCARQLASFLPGGFARFFEWMCPARPWRDFGTVQGRWERTVHEEWPRVKADIDSGHPSPLGLVHALSWDPRDVGKCHQVLAWGYELSGTAVRIKCCDPNHPQNAVIALELDLVGGNPIGWNGGPAPVHGFFRQDYRAALPPKV